MSFESYIEKVNAQWNSHTANRCKTPLWTDQIAAQQEPSIIPFLIEDKLPRGAVIICAGGAYMWKEPLEAFHHAVWLNAIGFHAFVLDYRVMPYKQPDSALMDIQRSVRILRHKANEWNVKKDKVALLGFSSGGHLTAMASTHFDYGLSDSSDPVERESCRPDAQILCYPHITYTPYVKDDPQFMVSFFGEGYTQADVDRVNVHRYISTDTPPAFLWGMQGDWQFKQQHWKLYTEALEEKSVSFSYHLFPNGSHGEGREPTSPIWKQWTMLCELWLKDLGF